MDLGAIGEDLYAFGSNRNLCLGFNDEDDRQFPERVYIKRPDHLLVRFHNEYLEKSGLEGPASQDLAKIPTLVVNRPLLIRDVVLSKMHSAVLTTDPVSNLYMCGIGRGGRLGLGDENTRFTYTPVLGPLGDRQITQVALGQNHTMAVDSTGSLWTWGNNADGQLGYALPDPPKKDEDPASTVPRQVFGPLKKEVILGVAASSIHSVAHTGSSLYCWGKNVGQLALMDADSRSLEYQRSPRKVAASLFSAPIAAVAAVDKATIVLLQSNIVWVFTGYGYHIVKFAYSHNHLLGPYRVESPRIAQIAAGGETIAILNESGSLFTSNLDHKIETNATTSYSSTTNPSKLKSAVTTPQCIWRSGNDGVKSVAVDDQGSVIISTRSGSVWKKVKRAKTKDAQFAIGDPKKRDFKFQRVPLITRASAVRASSGTFAAVRQDCDVMRNEPRVDGPSLWENIAALNCLKRFEASRPELDKDQGYWGTGSVKARFERLDPIAREVLRSATLEEDLKQHLIAWGYSHSQLDAAVCSSSEPDLLVPVHGWLLSGRSSVLRTALARFRKKGSCEQNETFAISRVGGKTVVAFQGLDTISLLNLVLFIYEDKVIPLWDFSSQSSAMSYRCRQVRLEVMKLATRLNMNSLEAAARLHAPPARCMNEDFRLATRDRVFFEDTDTTLVLDGAEVSVHSELVCQRCPWFEGLFHGRSKGRWLAGRRDTQDASTGSPGKISIDLDHMEPEAFKYVLRYLYGDYGEELFDTAICDSLDDFLDLVMQVMSNANYLMLDRLSQICQKIMARFADIRNISHLLNAISPCSITEFKDAGLEYICLQLEAMLENHLLDELDEVLILELDEVVRANQLAQLPFAKSGRAELVLHENHPELTQDIEEERQTRVKEMAYKSQKEEERKMHPAIKMRVGSFDDVSPATSSPDKTRKAARTTKNEPFSPSLKPRKSQTDMIFDMDEEEDGVSPTPSPATKPAKHPAAGREADQLPALESSMKSFGGILGAIAEPFTPRALEKAPIRPGEESFSPLHAKGGTPWKQPALPSAKLDLRDIIKSENTRTSALSAGLAAQKSKETATKFTQPKLSQKEKKRQQQQQAQAVQEAFATSLTPKRAWDKSPNDVSTSPWKLAMSKRTSSNQPQPTQSSPAPASPLIAAQARPIPLHRRTASPDTRFAGQRTASSSTVTTSASRPLPKPDPTTASASANTPRPAEQQAKPLVPHSKIYLPAAPKAEPLLGVSMVDIIGEQKRDKEVVREAVAKRSLQEIQQEQAFQEWWDAESRRTQDEEARRVAREREREERENSGAKKSGPRRGRSGKPRGGVHGGSGPGGGVADVGEEGPATGTGVRGRGKKGRAKGTPAGAHRGGPSRG